MTAVIAAVVGGTVISAGIGMYTANKSAKAQQKGYDTAADASTYNTNRNIEYQTQAEERARGALAPWRSSGARADWQLEKRMDAGPGEFIPEDQPGYKFGYQEFVEKPTLNAAAATGNLGGGSTLKALTKYAQDYASTTYDNFLNRYYKSLEPYQKQSAMGENAAALQGNQTMQTATQIGGALNQNSVNQSNAAVGSGNAVASGIINQGNVATGAINSGLNNWLLLRQMQPPGNVGGGTAGNMTPTGYRNPNVAY